MQLVNGLNRPASAVVPDPAEELSQDKKQLHLKKAKQKTLGI